MDRLQRKITLETPHWRLAPVFHLECFSYGLSSWSDPWVLSSHIPVLASCCSLTKPPLKVPDALGPHTCLAPLGTCSPCPHTCSAPVVALQTWDSSYALSLHLSQIFYFFQCQRMSVLEPRPRPGSTRPVGPWDSSESCLWGGGCGSWLVPPQRFGGLEGKHQETPYSWKQHTAPAAGSGRWQPRRTPSCTHCPMCTVLYAPHHPQTPSHTYHPLNTTHTPSHTPHTHIPHTPPHVHHPTHPACPQHTHSSQAYLPCSILVPLFLHILSTSKPDPDRLSVTVWVTHPIVGCDMVWHYQPRRLQGILVLA